MPGETNDLAGDDAAAWHTNVTAFQRVHVTGLYDGIDLVYGGTPAHLTSRYHVAAGADAAPLRLALEGADE